MNLDNENNPNGYREGVFTAHVGLYADYGSYYHSYTHVVELLYQRVARNEEPIDVVAYPLIYLMRHALELGYKYTLDHLYRINGERYNGHADNHSLVSMHAKVGASFKKFVSGFGVSNGVIEDFNRYYEITRVGMVEFDRMDKSSFTFRYPVDKIGKVVLDRDAKINLLTLKDTFDSAMTLLTTTADVLPDPSEWE